MQNIIDFIKSFNNPQSLLINTENDSIIFKKSNDTDTYKITLNQDHNTLIFKESDDTPVTKHFVNILNNSNLNNVNSLPELLDFIVKLNTKNYCICCDKLMDFQSDDYVSCGDKTCLYKFEELIIGNLVINKVTNDKDISEFLIKSAIDAVYSGREYDIFEPFPTHFLKFKTDIERGEMSKLTGKNYDNAKDFTKIKTLLDNFDFNNFYKIVTNCDSDVQLAKNIGNDLYILIRFVLLSCKVDIQKNDDILGLKSDKFKIYKVIHPIDKEDSFNKIINTNSTPTGYLFHGSRAGNWFSIVRNGLKNCSKSKLMTAGAAYGNGIYLSDDINLSFGYGLSGTKSVVGIFEVVDHQKYKKANTIYVVDDENALIQRYLLIIPSNNHYSFVNEINSIFNKTIYQEKINSQVKYNKKSLTKIIREYKQLKNNSNDLFRIEVNMDYPFEWKIFLTKFDDKYPIAQDMKKFGIKEIELEVRFPENYPFSPMFIRVVSPRFMSQTGHIGGSGGSICNELLTEKGWSPSFTIESVMVLIISEIIKGEGRLDPQKYHIPYTLQEAKDSFVRIAKSHGWM